MRRTQTGPGERVAGLRRAVAALEAVGPELRADDGPLDRAREVLERAGRRAELSSEHTVVALAGATGSGKSSLLNALAGVPAATVGARRPTTADPLAAVWDDGGSAAGAHRLLDWLEVGRRHEVTAPGTRDLSGLVLLDLPDVDSVRQEHHATARRLTDAVDVLVWVLDPQKYADDVVHAQFLRPLARHAAVTLVVLHQVDRLAAADRAAVLADLRDRLAEDGLRDVPVLAVSARTGEGVDDLRDAVGRHVRQRRAAAARSAADVATAADALASAYPTGRVGDVDDAVVRRLVEVLATAAGTDRVAAAVGGSFRHRARARTGWPPLRWLGRFRADPLRRLHLSAPVPEGGPEVSATSLPPASAPARAQVASALREVGERAAGDADEPWRTHLRQGATARSAELPDELDRVVAGAPLPGRSDPRWFGAVGALQWGALAVALVGALWLGVYALLGYLRIEVTWVPQLGPVPAHPPLPALPAIPWPTLLLAVGAVVGVLLALGTRAAARVGAARRERATRALLRRAVRERADAVVLVPVRERLGQVQDFADGLAAARR